MPLMKRGILGAWPPHGDLPATGLVKSKVVAVHPTRPVPIPSSSLCSFSRRNYVLKKQLTEALLGLSFLITAAQLSGNLGGFYLAASRSFRREFLRTIRCRKEEPMAIKTNKQTNKLGSSAATSNPRLAPTAVSRL